jgi:hypothetical protein
LCLYESRSGDFPVRICASMRLVSHGRNSSDLFIVGIDDWLFCIEFCWSGNLNYSSVYGFYVLFNYVFINCVRIGCNVCDAGVIILKYGTL